MRLFTLLCGIHAVVVTPFVHPGVFLNASDLTILASRLAAGTQPQAAAFEVANSSQWGSLSYRIFGPPSDGAVTCGSYDKPNIGCSNETSDADAAFLHALLFNLTGKVAHASLSRRIVNTYTSGLRSYNDSNAPLQAAWCGVKWTRAAELLRWSAGSGWTAADTAAFASMVTNIHLPLIRGGSRANGNWELSMIDAMLSIAAFLEDSALLQHALGFWRQRTPAYFYNAAIDGGQPAPFPPGREGASWYNQTVFNASTNGVCQETCRDFGHMQMGLGACLSAAATARIAGVDLFAEQAPRLAGAMEFAAGWLLQGGKPQSPLLCSGAPLNLALVATFEVGFRELGARLGHALPLTQKQLALNVRPHASPDSIVSDWETLTHGVPFGM
jgi:hypothetical protein